jgi:hypothetical protein
VQSGASSGSRHRDAIPRKRRGIVLVALLVAGAAVVAGLLFVRFGVNSANKQAGVVPTAAAPPADSAPSAAPPAAALAPAATTGEPSAAATTPPGPAPLPVHLADAPAPKALPVTAPSPPRTSSLTRNPVKPAPPAPPATTEKVDGYDHL